MAVRREFPYLGAGTTVIRHEPRIKVTEGAHTYIDIDQTIELHARVLLGSSPHHVCSVCSKTPPLPDAAGAEFILANNDGGRLVFPYEEDVKPERDCYPVTGWKRFKKPNGGTGLICDVCLPRLEEIIDAFYKAGR